MFMKLGLLSHEQFEALVHFLGSPANRTEQNSDSAIVKIVRTDQKDILRQGNRLTDIVLQIPPFVVTGKDSLRKVLIVPETVLFELLRALKIFPTPVDDGSSKDKIALIPASPEYAEYVIATTDVLGENN
jgi:hypothetical protein